jgi:pyruvate-formate lyase-activating enzyme
VSRFIGIARHRLTVDGDGVTTLVCFYGCTLRCKYCKNARCFGDVSESFELTPEELPPTTLQVDIARNGRISMGNITLTPEQIGQRVKERKRKFGGDFPILIRADYRTRHEAVARVMNACTAAGVWKISFMAVYERKAKD